MSSKVITVRLPEKMLPEIARAAQKERRSRSELIEEAIRQYLEGGGRTIPLDDATADEAQAITRGRRQIKRGEFIRLEDLQNELGLSMRHRGGFRASLQSSSSVTSRRERFLAVRS